MGTAERQIANPNNADVVANNDSTRHNPSRLHSDAYAENTSTRLTAGTTDVRQWARNEMEASNPQLKAAIAQMDQLNDAIKRHALQPGSPQYQQALQTALQSCVNGFKAPSGIHEQLTAADSMMRQLNLAVENGYIQVSNDPKSAYSILRDAAVTAYMTAAKHAEKDLSAPQAANALSNERTQVQNEIKALQGALNGQSLSPQDMQQLGLTSNDPAAIKAALQRRVQDDLTLEDMSRSVGIVHANLGLALIRSSMDLDGDAKNQRVQLGVQELQKAQLADKQTANDSDFQKHLGIVTRAAGLDGNKVLQAMQQPDNTTTAPTGAPASPAGAVPDINTRPRLPGIDPPGTNEVWGPNHTKNQSFNNPFDLVQLAEQGDKPQLDKLRLAVQAADSIDRKTLELDMQEQQQYIDQALGPNGPKADTLRPLIEREKQDQQAIKEAQTALSTATRQLMQGQGVTQPQAAQFVAFIQKLSNANSSAELMQMENDTQNRTIKTALQSSELGRQILGLNGDGIIDKLVKAKEDKAGVESQIQSTDPRLLQAYRIANFDSMQYLSSVTTRMELMGALINDLGTNQTLSQEQKQSEGTEAVKLAKELAQMNPAMLNPQHPYYAPYKNMLAALNLTPEQVGKAVGVITDTGTTAAPTQPGNSALSDPVLSALATAGGDPALQSPAQKAAILLDSIQKAGGKMTAEQNQQFQKLLADAKTYVDDAAAGKHGTSLEQYRQQLEARSKEIAAKLHGIPKFEEQLSSFGATARTVDELLSQLQNVNNLALANLKSPQKVNTYNALESLLSQIDKATDQNQQQTLNQNLRTMMDQDPDVKRYVISTGLINYINGSAEVQKYFKDEQNFLLATNNLELVKGMYGEALLAAGDAKDAALLITEAHNTIPTMMPSLAEAQQRVQQALVPQSAAPGSTVRTQAYEVPTAPSSMSLTAGTSQPGDLPPGVIPGVTTDATSMPTPPAAPAAPGAAPPQGGAERDPKVQQMISQIPGLENLIRAQAATRGKDPVAALEAADADFQAAVKAAPAVNQEQARQFTEMLSKLTAAIRQVQTAEQLKAKGQADPNPQATQAAMNVINTLGPQAEVLKDSLAEPANARYSYAEALNNAAVALYQQADKGGADQAALRSRADALSAKALGLLKEIGQVDPTYGYTSFIDPQNLPQTDEQKQQLIAKAHLVVDGAIKAVQQHQAFTAGSALSQGVMSKAEEVISDGLTKNGIDALQPIWTIKNLLGNIPGMGPATAVADVVMSTNPVSIWATYPLDFATQPTMDAAHYSDAVIAATQAKLTDLENNTNNAQQTIDKNKGTWLDKAVHMGIDFLSGPTAMAIASRLPLPWWARAGLAVAGTAGMEKGLDKGSNWLLGTHEMDNTELFWHTTGSVGMGVATNVGSFARGLGEARVFTADANTALAAAQQAAKGQTTAPGVINWIRARAATAQSFVSPTNFAKGITYQPFALRTEEIAAAAGGTERVPRLAENLSAADISARRFWGRVPAASVTGGAAWSIQSIGDVNPYMKKADGTYYTVGDTAQNMGMQFLNGTAGTAGTLTFFGVGGAAFRTVGGYFGGSWLGRGVGKIVSGTGELLAPIGRHVMPPNGELPAYRSVSPSGLPTVETYDPKTVAPGIRNWLRQVAKPEVPTPTAQGRWQTWGEAVVNQSPRIQTTPLIMPGSAAVNDWYAYHVWDSVDQQSDDKVRDILASRQVRAMQQQQQQPGAGGQ